MPLSPTHQAVQAQLASFARFGVELGLTRIEQLLASLGQPQRQVPIIHVAGTNGKGSVCAYLSTVLAIAGYRVGRYTSPHLVDWTERICLNNQPIPIARLQAVLDQIQAHIDPSLPSPTQFEVITAAAWLYFAQEQVDLAIMEVGLGGRLDATNVCDRPILSIITSISRDHWQRLGPTLGHIAGEKAGILKANCPAVIGPMPPEAQPVMVDRSIALTCPVAWVIPAIAASHPSDRAAMTEPEWQYHPPQIQPAPAIRQFTPAPDPNPEPFTYRSGLRGAHQGTNSAIAITALRYLQAQGWNITPDHIRQGLAHTQWPGRLQWIEWQGRSLLLDGAHNGAAAEQLAQFVQPLRQTEAGTAQPITWIVGMLETKDHPAILRALLAPGDRLTLVSVPDHLSADVTELQTLAQQLCPELATCATIPAVETAIPTTIAQTPTAQPIVLAGSLYLVGYVLNLWHSHSGRSAESMPLPSP